MHRAAQAYFQTGVTTTGQGDILLMLYDGAIKFMNQAKERLDANDMAGKGNNITKALQILDELSGTLDMEKGGELSENLRNLYIFCTNRLVMANIKKSTEMIDEVIKIITGLRAAFAAIVDLPEAQEAAAQVAASQRASGILPARAQQGTAAPVASAPGAGARLRNFYAQNQQQSTPVEEQAESMPESRETTAAEAQAVPPPALGAQDAVKTASSPATSGAPKAATALSMPDSPKAVAGQSVSEQPSGGQAPSAAVAPAVAADEGTGPAAGFSPLPGSFGGKMMGSSLYKKMAQQQ